LKQECETVKSELEKQKKKNDKQTKKEEHYSSSLYSRPITNNQQSHINLPSRISSRQIDEISTKVYLLQRLVQNNSHVDGYLRQAFEDELRRGYVEIEKLVREAIFSPTMK